MPDFAYHPRWELTGDDTPYKLLTRDFVETVKLGDYEFLRIHREGLARLAAEALADVNFFLRPSHLGQLRGILEDPEASDNDRFVAMTLLRNAVEAAQGILPSCQDTGTATILGKRGQRILTDYDDADALAEGVQRTYAERNLRYSQLAPISLFEERNTGTNLPAQIDIESVMGAEYKFLFLAKGGGSANKTMLFQETKSLLNEKSLKRFLTEKLSAMGTAACPPYHLALVIGGTSAEATLKAVKLASAGYLDNLPEEGNAEGRAFRDRAFEKTVRTIAEESGIGAQFGGKYFVHDVRVIRLPRHAASCPVGLGVSCSADRNIKAKITAEGIFLESLERRPDTFVPASNTSAMVDPVRIDLNRPMAEILAELAKHPVKTRLSLSGPMIVARDVAHARILAALEQGKPMPDYFKNHPIYYAGPAKTPAGLPSGSFGPTTAGRMDPYVKPFMALGGSRIMVAKGNRSPVVRQACKEHGGFYLGSIGGPAAVLARENIQSVETIDFEDLGMEAIRRIVVKDFPAFIVVNDQGDDFFANMKSAES